MNNEQIFSVAELTEYIQDLLEEDPLLNLIWVQGEISSTKSMSMGTFFSLTDLQGNNGLNCVVWQNQRHKLKQQPQVGEEVIALGSIRIYRQRGEYRLHVWQILPVGDGLQASLLEQLYIKLKSEGLFDLEKKRPLPSLPQCIAVVTSNTAAAWGDIQTTIKQRYSGLKILLATALVQGKQAPESIVNAIERVNQDGRAEVIILARGGGATEDLSCFNDERVVRAIASSNIPIVTGIGHERDQSLADLAADIAVHTPTATAELVVPDYRQLWREYQQQKQKLFDVFKRRINQETEYLESLKQRIKQLPFNSRSLLNATSKLEVLQEKLIALNPNSVLNRGYAVVRNSNHHLVTNNQQIQPEEELIIELAQGTIKVKVTEILP
jgi:exodeoxyribonuclease VII large subunit